MEVLYGARDAEGNPIPPESESDGHGRWLALKKGNSYLMLSWLHPAYEGGACEYGKGLGENALSDLEHDIAEKERICLRAEELADSRDWRGASAEHLRLFEEWKNTSVWHTPREDKLWKRFQAARKTFYGNRTQEREKSKEAKQGIISEAQALKDSTDWKPAGEQFKELMSRWKAAGSAGWETDEELWQEFDEARQAFYGRRSEFFEELDRQHAEHRKQKEELIEETRESVRVVTDWKAAGDDMVAFMDRWKAIGSAGRVDDARLWEEFRAVREDFYERRKSYYAERSKMFQERAEQKKRIAREAADLAKNRDYSGGSADRMRSLDQEWRSIGFAGHNKEEQLWEVFKSARDSFWLGKKAQGVQRQQEWVRRTREAVDRKKTQIDNLNDQISNLQFKISTTADQEYIDKMTGWIGEKEERIREIEMSISEMEGKLQAAAAKGLA